jgi:acyl-homoserine-lactone acylase
MVLGGFNGKVAWSATSVIGDNQDLFLENQTPGQWPGLRKRQMAAGGVRNETYFVKGQRPIREAVYETRHGPCSTALRGWHRATVSAWPCKRRASPTTKPWTRFLTCPARRTSRRLRTPAEIRAIALNMVFADASNIGWQVTGRFPNRREGEGLLPSPGWEGRYDWDGYADPMLHPYDQDPAQGWLGTANQRVIPRGYGMQLSNSWAAPERGERLAELANGQA